MKQHPKVATPPLVQEPEALYRTSAAAILRRTGKPPQSLVESIREGLPFAEFTALCGLLDLSAEALGGYLNISRSTLIRRKQRGRLAPDESDRLIRFARLYGRAAEVLGSREAGRTWLKSPARALGPAIPLAYADTEAGAREVEHLLGRIEYGVYS